MKDKNHVRLWLFCVSTGSDCADRTGARDDFHLAATAQNLRKLAKLIPMPVPKLV